MTRPSSPARILVLTALLSALSFASIAPSLAGSRPDYLDDRSSGASLVRSLYNAIDREEYLRAYAYFGEGARPSTYESFADGYAHTARIRLKLGTVRREGAAGSLYTNVPAAIEATDDKGKVSVFSGCYITRLADPAAQATPPFEPLQIEKATLRASTQGFEAVKPVCNEP